MANNNDSVHYLAEMLGIVIDFLLNELVNEKLFIFVKKTSVCKFVLQRDLLKAGSSTRGQHFSLENVTSCLFNTVGNAPP